jgi:DNA polymerase-3 subunit epsilon
LLQKYLHLAKLKNNKIATELSAFVPGEGNGYWPTLHASGKSAQRKSFADSSNHSFVHQIISRLSENGSEDTAAYYSILDRALEDRVLSPDEIKELTTTALQSGLSPSALKTAHHEYVKDMVAVALQDNVISKAEMSDLETIASLLSIEQSFLADTIKQLKKVPCTQHINIKGDTETESLIGKKVCFTGTMTSYINGKEMSRELAEQLATTHGLIPVPGVTKKTNILVVADPHSMSGKAKKAREYQIRIIAERAFWRLLGVDVD